MQVNWKKILKKDWNKGWHMNRVLDRVVRESEINRLYGWLYLVRVKTRKSKITPEFLTWATLQFREQFCVGFTNNVVLISLIKIGILGLLTSKLLTENEVWFSWPSKQGLDSICLILKSVLCMQMPCAFTLLNSKYRENKFIIEPDLRLLKETMTTSMS